jgi:predicted enzyme related to lactoylglutathione lyase
MPARDSHTSGAPCWIDLQTSDLDRARHFYGTVFGWTSDDPNPDFGNYVNFRKDGVLVAGLMRADDQAPVSDIWSVYLATDDAEKTTQQAIGAGAQVIVPPMTVGDMGTMGFVIDPTGAAVGLWQPGSHRGFGRVAEPGAPSWWELLTRDYPGALTFYRDAFGWRTQTLSDTDEFRYSVQVDADGEGQLAGVMDAGTWLPPEVPPHWGVYLGVADTDEAVEKIVDLGGSVMQPAQDTPFGRIAHVTDPMGANLRLVAANEQMPAKDE